MKISYKWLTDYIDIDMSIEEIAQKIKEGANKDIIDNLKKEAKRLGEEIPKIDEKAKELLEKRDEIRYKIGNITHESVPIAEDEEGNEIIRTVGNLPNFSYEPLSHVDLIEIIDGADIKRASKVSGTRFYYLKNDIALLNIALMQFALNHLTSIGFTPMWTPFFIKYDFFSIL